MNWHDIWFPLSRIGIAYLVSLPMGWESEKEHEVAGVRTFPIVAMAACGFMLAVRAIENDPAAQSRALQGLIAGIGFIGGGAILKEGATARGTATAASIWNVGVIGAAVAMEHFEIAIVLSVLNVLTLFLLIPVKNRLSGNKN